MIVSVWRAAAGQNKTLTVVFFGVGLCLVFLKTGTGFVSAFVAGVFLACLWIGFCFGLACANQGFVLAWLSQNGFCFGVQRHAQKKPLHAKVKPSPIVSPRIEKLVRYLESTV